jgi:predicted transcriptional regulator
MAKKMHEDMGVSIGDICLSLKISRATLYRYIAL